MVPQPAHGEGGLRWGRQILGDVVHGQRRQAVEGLLGLSRQGAFPKEYVHGNAWSLYLPGGSPDSSKLKVEVYKLTRRPERAFGMTEEIDGKPLPVAHVSTASNAINFEPDSQTLGRGIYWVRVRGDAVREGYVVELY